MLIRALLAISVALFGTSSSLAQDSKGCKDTGSPAFLLRQNFSDIHLFDCATSVANAKGAEFSWSSDNVTNDDTWSVAGMAALALPFKGDFSKSPGQIAYMGAMVVPYAQLNRVTHSSLISKNVDTRIYGLSVELGFDADTLGRHYLRSSASSVDNEIKNSNYFHGIFEWIPVSKDICLGTVCGLLTPEQLAMHQGVPQILFRVAPELKIQYDQALENSAPVTFSGKTNSLRVGPEVTVVARLFYKEALPVLGGLVDLTNFVAKVTYHWDVETYSGNNFSWFDASLTYNIGKEGHLGLSASYQKGEAEETGAPTDIYKVTLTGKF
jgi:hypothetical protein